MNSYKHPRTILLVEDEESLRELVQLNLELEGYRVQAAASGFDALESLSSGRFHAVILDVMLPGMDGFEVCERIKLHQPQLPVLFLSAKNATDDRVTGLKKGDDYMVKPFDIEELLLRLTNLIDRADRSRSADTSPEKFLLGTVEVDLGAYMLRKKGGEQRALSQKEALLLRLLYSRNGEVVSRDEILLSVWQNDGRSSARTVDNYIAQLRRFIEYDSKSPKFIISVRGVGYKLSLQATPEK